MPGASQLRIYEHRMWGQLSTTCSNVTEVAQWGAPVAVDHSQPLTMASETIDPIDWPLPLTIHSAVPTELHVLYGVNAGYKSQDLLQQPGSKHVRVLGYACAATLGALKFALKITMYK